MVKSPIGQTPRLREVGLGAGNAEWVERREVMKKDYEQIYNSPYRHHFSNWHFRGVIPKVLNAIHKRNGTAGSVG